MIAASLDLGAVAHDWLAALLRASWQGAIGIGVVWCLCRGVRSIPPWARCWMWRLVLVKAGELRLANPPLLLIGETCKTTPPG